MSAEILVSHHGVFNRIQFIVPAENSCLMNMMLERGWGETGPPPGCRGRVAGQDIPEV
jgi:hypothetical protein